MFMLSHILLHHYFDLNLNQHFVGSLSKVSNLAEPCARSIIGSVLAISLVHYYVQSTRRLQDSQVSRLNLASTSLGGPSFVEGPSHRDLIGTTGKYSVVNSALQVIRPQSLAAIQVRSKCQLCFALLALLAMLSVCEVL